MAGYGDVLKASRAMPPPKPQTRKMPPAKAKGGGGTKCPKCGGKMSCSKCGC